MLVVPMMPTGPCLSPLQNRAPLDLYTKTCNPTTSPDVPDELEIEFEKGKSSPEVPLGTESVLGSNLAPW